MPLRSAIRTVIDQVFPKSQIAETHAYSATGRAKGLTVLMV